MGEAGRNLLILDLDETLIFATEEKLQAPADFEVFQYFVYKRPHLDEFIRQVSQWYDLAVWSSASDPYVEAISQKIFPTDIHLNFVWGRSRATLPRNFDPHLYWDINHQHFVKDLSKLKKKGWPLRRILIVDDTPEKSARNYGNAIYPQIFEGDEEDEELLLLANYLETLKDCQNVRVIEKRRWRDQTIRLQQQSGEVGALKWRS